MTAPDSRRRIVIIGGGIAGTSVAWALAEHHEVTLLEAEAQLGEHATGRSAAILSETSGHRVVCTMASASRTFLEHPPDAFAEHALTAERGLLWIGRHGDEHLLDDIAAIAALVAPTAARVDATRAMALVPELRSEAVAAGGVWEPDARSIDVGGLLAAYARTALRRGAEIHRRSEARSLSATPAGGWIVDTGDWAIECDVVVDAAGAWGDVVAARAGVTSLGLRPLRRTACLVRAPDLVRSWPLVMDAAGRCYFEPEAGGLLLSPADEHPSEPGDARAEMEDVAWALDVLAETTTLDVRSVRREWAGLRTFTPDRVPAIGWDADAPGFFWLVGQGGAGIKTAPAAAELAAAMIEGRAPALTDVGVLVDDLAPGRFRTGSAARSGGRRRG